MRVWLLLAGEYGEPRWSVATEDIVIAVDGGIRHAATLGVIPSLWLGDFDSTDTALHRHYHDLTQQRYPTDKDATDFELALTTVQQLYPHTTALSIVGALGGEWDHAFANLWVLPRFAITTVLWGQHQHVIYSHGAHISWICPIGSTISLFALTPLTAMAYSGLRWPAPQQGLMPHSALASRNMNVEERVSVQWRSGDGIIVIPKNSNRLNFHSTP